MDLEFKIQNLIRYGWLVEREWNTYVVSPSAAAKGSRKKSSKSGLFPSSFLQGLETWHMSLTRAIVRVRQRPLTLSYSHLDAGASNAQPQDPMTSVQMLSPHQWSTEYILEKYKAEKAKTKKSDPWLDGVPQVTGMRIAQKSCIQLTDVRRRNLLHYAAQSPAHLVQLKRLHYLDLQELRQHAESSRVPALAALDLFGDSPLTIAASNGNTDAVRYIIEESDIDDFHASLVDAAVAAFSEGEFECLPLIVKHLAQFPEKVALTIRIAMFYGFDKLFEAVCAALTAAGSSACAEAEAALEQSANRAGGCTILHLAVLNGRCDMVKCALEQQIFRTTEFNSQSRDDAWLTPLDIANYFGYRTCADQLVNTFTFFCPPLALNFDPEDAALHVEPFVPKKKELTAPPDTYAVYVMLGSNDVRRIPAMPPITIDETALHSVLDDLGLPRSTHLLLRIDSEQGMEVTSMDGWLADVATLIETPDLFSHAWQPPAHFHTLYPERFVLKLDLIALVDQALYPYADEQKVIAQAAVFIPPTFIPSNSERTPGSYAPVCPAAGNYISAVFMSSIGGVVGEANLEVLVAAPYKHKVSEFNVPKKVSGSAYAMSAWQEPGQTLVYGHRGAGMNFLPNSGLQKLQLGENTVLSMQQAIYEGVSGVEFDVQMTRDMVPVIYHDWTMAETGMDIPISTLTLKQFLEHNPCNNQQLVRSRSSNDLPDTSYCASLTDSEPAADDGDPKPVHIANSANTVRAPLATLEDLFESIPEDIGFDIEIKYPMPDEADMANVFTNFEINLFVDKILDVVYKHIGVPADVGAASTADEAEEQKQQQNSRDARPLTRTDSGMLNSDVIVATGAGSASDSKMHSAKRRPVVFTSFHPDICLLLAHKLNNDIPIMLLTDAGMSVMADCRCNSLDAAVRLCNWAGLSGVVTHVAPISQSPRVASLVRRHRLALATYGTPANHLEHVRQQQAYGVDMVIVDDVRTARAAVDAGDDAWK
ncbi:Glycerophosphoryl diester phosphodiesterase family-domain-containing protein [Coemansia spiralis]|nr:Glycerophosphoryl diester phosphodiesterase family-domain-containing protein [Coemansia spiralis]